MNPSFAHTEDEDQDGSNLAEASQPLSDSTGVCFQTLRAIAFSAWHRVSQPCRDKRTQWETREAGVCRVLSKEMVCIQEASHVAGCFKDLAGLSSPERDQRPGSLLLRLEAELVHPPSSPRGSYGTVT